MSAQSRLVVEELRRRGRKVMMVLECSMSKPWRTDDA